MGAVRRIRGGGGGAAPAALQYRVGRGNGGYVNIRSAQNSPAGVRLPVWGRGNGNLPGQPNLGGTHFILNTGGRFLCMGEFDTRFQKNVAGAAEPEIGLYRSSGGVASLIGTRNDATRSISVNLTDDQIHAFGHFRASDGDLVFFQGEHETANTTRFELNAGVSSVVLIKLGDL